MNCFHIEWVILNDDNAWSNLIKLLLALTACFRCNLGNVSKFSNLFFRFLLCYSYIFYICIVLFYKLIYKFANLLIIKHYYYYCYQYLWTSTYLDPLGIIIIVEKRKEICIFYNKNIYTTCMFTLNIMFPFYISFTFAWQRSSETRTVDAKLRCCECWKIFLHLQNVKIVENTSRKI